MKQTDEIWSRLTKVARQPRDDHEIKMPTGFAARVVARGLNANQGNGSLFEPFAMRMVGLSCLLALFAVVTHISFQGSAEIEDPTTAFFQVDDAATIILGEDGNG